MSVTSSQKGNFNQCNQVGQKMRDICNIKTILSHRIAPLVKVVTQTLGVLVGFFEMAVGGGSLVLILLGMWLKWSGSTFVMSKKVKPDFIR